MEIKDLELKLLAGIPIDVPNIGKIHPLSCRQVAEMGLDQYYNYINHLCFDIDSLDIDYEYKCKLKEEGVKTYNIIISNCLNDDRSFLDTIIEALELFFREDVVFNSEYCIFFIGDQQEGRYISQDNYENIKLIFKKMNCMQVANENDNYNPGNERAKKFIEKLKKNKANRPKSKEDINLYSLISGIAWKSHIGINSVWDLTIYQLYDAHDRLQIVDDYDKTIHGIYSGTVDSKKINMKDINWSKAIKT